MLWFSPRSVTLVRPVGIKFPIDSPCLLRFVGISKMPSFAMDVLQGYCSEIGTNNARKSSEFWVLAPKTKPKPACVLTRTCFICFCRGGNRTASQPATFSGVCRVETKEYRRKHGLQKKTLQTWSLLPPAYKADVYHKTSCIKLACPFFLAMAPSLQMTTCLGIARGGSREIDEEIIMHDCFFVRSECWFSMVLWFCGLATMAQRAPDTRCSVVEVSQMNTKYGIYTWLHLYIPKTEGIPLHPRMLWEASAAHAMGSLHYPAWSCMYLGFRKCQCGACVVE